MCNNIGHMGADRNGVPYECSTMFNCCDCGVSDGDGCGCSYCFSCNACDECLNNDE